MSHMSGGPSTRTPSERARVIYLKDSTEVAQYIHPLNRKLYGAITFTSKADKAFFESIRQHGVMEPLVMCQPTVPHYGKRDGGHRGQLEYLVSGHRRLAAALELGCKKVPVRFYSE